MLFSEVIRETSKLISHPTVLSVICMLKINPTTL